MPFDLDVRDAKRPSEGVAPLHDGPAHGLSIREAPSGDPAPENAPAGRVGAPGPSADDANYSIAGKEQSASFVVTFTPAECAQLVELAGEFSITLSESIAWCVARVWSETFGPAPERGAP